MNNTALVIITALISGLLATLVTIWWQRKSSIYSRKMRAFETMMAYRYMIHAEESVKAINSVGVIFYKDVAVRKALESFMNEAAKSSEFNPNIGDKHLKLLEEMAKALRLKDIHWDDIKQIYYPNGLAEKLHDEEVLRKIQIQNAVDTAHRNKEQENTLVSNQFGEQLALQLLPDLIKNPESLKVLMEMTKKGEKK